MADSNGWTRRGLLVAGAAGTAALAATAALRGEGAPAPGKGAELDPGPNPIPVAFLMDDGATMIDFAGPWEVFQDAQGGEYPGFQIYTVAAHQNQLQTTGNMSGSGADMKMSGLKFTADYAFADAPQPRVIVIGAQSQQSNPAKMAWIRAAAERADVVMSVCTGAFVLASSGLLDGRKATTHHEFLDSFATKFPKVELERGRRFVDNGKFITAGGLTSGIDAALHVVTRYYGTEFAGRVAEYMEYQSRGWIA
jgi:transcriptional regulator GlxA family with amidase domain